MLSPTLRRNHQNCCGQQPTASRPFSILLVIRSRTPRQIHGLQRLVARCLASRFYHRLLKVLVHACYAHQGPVSLAIGVFSIRRLLLSKATPRLSPAFGPHQSNSGPASSCIMHTRPICCTGLLLSPITTLSISRSRQAPTTTLMMLDRPPSVTSASATTTTQMAHPSSTEHLAGF